jgi:MFS family permease
MQLAHFYNRHRLYRLSAHPDLHNFEFAMWLHALARSLISVYVPILLLESGYSLSDVIVFYLLFNTIDIPLNFVVERILRKIGARKVMILGTIATIAFFGLLGILPPDNWPLLFLLAVLAAVYDTLFWIAHVYLFIEVNREGIDAGKSVGALEGIRQLAYIVGPLIGALILIVLGKGYLAIASIIIFALSIIPLFRMRHVRDLPNEKKLSIRGHFSSLQDKKNYLILALWSVHDEVDGIIWPLFIFTVFGTIESVAIIPVMVSISTIIFSYLVGRLTKQHGIQMITIGAALVASIWLLRITITNPYLLYASIFIVGISSLLVTIPVDANITSIGLRAGSLATATQRNIISMILRIPLYVVLLLLVNVFKISFGVAAICLIFILYITLISSRRMPVVVTK